MSRSLLALAALFAASAHAAPLTIAHSGRLLDASGAPINGARDVTVALYDGTGAVWTDTFDAVPVTDGYFAVVLGSGLALDGDLFRDGALEVGVLVDTAPELRQPLHSVPYALSARSAAEVSGGIQVGATGACATTADAGRLRWSNDALQVCDGAAWQAVVTDAAGSGATRNTAGLSCKTIHQDFPALDSGTYWIDPDGDADRSDAFEVYCDMDTHDGGWTRCLSARYFTGAKPAGWAKNTWVSGTWNTGSTVLAGDYTGSAYGNFCAALAGVSTQMYGGATYNPSSGWTNFVTAPIPYASGLFSPSGNGNWAAAGTSIGLDSNQRGIYGSNCDTDYTSNTLQGMQSLCFEDGTGRYQAQHTGWTCGTYTGCSDSCNQPCFCTQTSYCGGTLLAERDIVMSVYLR